MYTRILIPVDGSDASSSALAETLKFAREQRARVRLVYVCETPQYVLAEGPVNLAEEIRRYGEQVLSGAAARARESGVSAEAALVEAADRRVAEAIAGEATSWDANLIAMGTHGRGGFEHLLLGSVAEGVARRATVPVLLLRSK